jgi:hypothetical protein
MSTVTATGTIEAVVDAAVTTDNSTNELQVPTTDRKRKRPWSKNKATDEKRIDSINDSDDDKTNTTATKTGDINPPGPDTNKDVFPPVRITELYRFHTKFEIFTGFIGLFAAVCAGAAQVSRASHLSQSRP